MTDRELMQMALDAMEDLHRTGDTQVFDLCHAPELIPALRARLAQPEPEHRNVVIAGDLWRVEFLPDNDANVRLLRANYTALPQRQQRTYTLRKWQGLTDEEIEEGQKQSWVDKQAFESAVWWAEEKLKEKNT
jgi:DNA-directed RNA polymerase specialized sigma24 family protein